MTHLGGMRNVWFTADTHFGHANIALYTKRDFCMEGSDLEVANQIWSGDRQKGRWSPSPDSVMRMDEHLLGMINEFVAEDDILWHLGDFCFWNKNSSRDAHWYLSRIRCRNVCLVAGNHDQKETRDAFGECCDYKEIKVHSKDVIMSHYAMCFWNRSHYGSWMLYGHAHGSAERWLDENMPGRTSMDVGVDNARKLLGEYRPFSFDDISSIFASRKGFNSDKNRFSRD